MKWRKRRARRRRELFRKVTRRRAPLAWILPPHLEQLEERTLLTVPAGWESYSQVSATWLEEITPHVVDLTASRDYQENDGSSPYDRWIVRLSPEATLRAASVSGTQELLDSDADEISVIRGLGLPGQVLIESAIQSRAAVEASLEANPWVKSIERDCIINSQAFPNDSPNWGTLTTQWGLHNVGQAGGTSDADIDAPEAWEVTTGSSNVIVAVLDSGIDYTHPDLAANMWVNPNEIPDNGIDDDGNGFTDDVHGWNFNRDASDGDPLDDFGHGTHVAGIIGAVGNNGEGIAGVSWQVSLMAIKVLDENGMGYVGDAITAVNYVTYMRRQFGIDVRVMNNSWINTEGDSAGLEDAIRAAGEAGILFVTSAGNGTPYRPSHFRPNNNDLVPVYPASYDLENVVGVTATDRHDELVPFVNFGRDSVDLAAPGMEIYSTEPGGGYGFRGGTSMSAAYVSGVAALVWAQTPYATVAEVRSAILQGVDSDPVLQASLQNKVATNGRLNAYHSMLVDTVAPRAVLTSATDVTQRGVSTHQFTVEYADNHLVQHSSLSNSDVVVRRVGTAGPDLVATLASVNNDSDQLVLAATYQVAASGGEWDVPDNGVYEVFLQSDEVFDANSNAARPMQWDGQPPMVLGTFTIAVPPVGLIIVNSFADTVDVNPGDGVCADASGNATLRAAIMEANARSGDNTIWLAAGSYALTRDGSWEDGAATGDLDVTDTTGSLTIVGQGQSQTYIDANEIDRVFDVFANVTFVLSSLTVRDGAGGLWAEGGNIYNRGNLTLRESSVLNGWAFSGGGIYNLGQLTLTTVRISGNQATSYSPYFIDSHEGGGIYNSGNIWGTNVTISNNTGYFNTEGDRCHGGGLFNNGRVTLMRSSISGNFTDWGGGVYSAAGSVTLVEVTVSANDVFRGGGGIYSLGLLSLTDVIIANNSARYGLEYGGGGLYNASTASISRAVISENKADKGGGVYNAGTLQLSDVTVSDNTFFTSGSSWGLGGAGILNEGSLTYTTGTVSGNTSDLLGGGIYNNSLLTLRGIAILGNEAIWGGGIYSEGTIEIHDSSVSNNTAFVGGGGIQIERPTSSMTIFDSEVSDNTAGDIGGGISNGGGFESFDGGTVEITRSAILRNATPFDDWSGSDRGGGIYSRGGHLTIQESTLADNSAFQGAGIFSEGGNTLSIANSTLSGNLATLEGGGIYHTGGSATVTSSTIYNSADKSIGGGIYSAVRLDLQNTIVAGNAHQSGTDLAGSEFVSLGHNLIGDTSGTTGWVGSDLLNIDPLLGPLEDNRGPTPTHALLPGSPAIDAGDSATAPSTDQRGVARPQDGNGDGTAIADIGAVERYYAEVRGSVFHDLDSDQGWHQSSSPFVGVNNTGTTQTKPSGAGVVTWPDESVLVHPSNGLVVASWLCPADSIVDLSYQFSDADANGGNGIRWFVELVGKTGLTTLASGDYPDGGDSGPLSDQSVSVAQGDRLNFVIDANTDASFDATLLTAAIMPSIQGGTPATSLTDDFSHLSNRVSDKWSYWFKDDSVRDGNYVLLPNFNHDQNSPWGPGPTPGAWDTSEPALEGWSVELWDVAGQVKIAETVTAADGSYRLANVDPGTYTVREVERPGWVQTAPASPDAYSVGLGIADVITGVNFGNLAVSGVVQGRVFSDLDGDGTFGASELGISDWQVYLDLSGDGDHDPGEPIAVTGADGSYHFADLTPGDYIVREVLRSGWNQSAPTIGNQVLADFNNDLGNADEEGFVVAGAAEPWQWELTDARASNAGHSGDHAFYFGTGEGPSGGGHYRANAHGTLTSPIIDLRNVSGTVVLEFNHLLDIEAYDTVAVSMLSRQQIGDDWIKTVLTDNRDASGLGLLTEGFETVRLDVSAFAGKEIQLQFEFRSDEVVNRTESVSTEVTAGETYYVQVAGFEGSTHPLYNLSVDSPGTLPIIADRFESNDGFSMATNLGTLAHRAESGLTIHASENDDYYRLVVPANETVHAHLFFEHDRGDLDLILYDAAQNGLKASQSRTDNEFVEYTNPSNSTPVEIIIRVTGYDGATHPSYDLVIQPPAIESDPLEENDSFAAAADLGRVADFSQANLTFDDADYYQFVADQSGLVGVRLAFHHGLGNLDLELYDSAQVKVASSMSRTDDEAIWMQMVAGETYFVRVFSSTGDTQPDYELIIDGPTINPDLIEPNNDFTNATVLDSLGYIEVTGLTIHQTADADYYRFVPLESGMATVSLLFDQTAGDVDLFLYDSAHNLLTSSQKEGWYIDDVLVTALGRYDVDVAAGGVYEDRNFGNAYDGGTGGAGASGEIGGRLFYDLNGNRIRDNSETGLGGREIYLGYEEDGQLVVLETTVTQQDDPETPDDETGTYEFTYLPPGEFLVGLVDPNAGKQTFPVENEFTVNEIGGFPEPQKAVFGRFNDDEWPDLAVVNGSSSELHVLLNQGDGSFLNRTIIFIEGPQGNPSNLASLVAADLNNDGYSDLAVVGWSTSHVSVILNTGDGSASFDALNNYLVGIEPLTVIAGYLDNDTYLDLAVANDYSGTISVLLNKGSEAHDQAGKFNAAHEVAVGYAPLSVTAGYLNDDEHLDLAVANYGDPNESLRGSVAILTNNGQGAFDSLMPDLSAGMNPCDVATGDFDGDGDVDLAVANADSAGVTIFRRESDGSFSELNETLSIGTGVTSILAVDVDNDSDLDLAVSTGADRKMVILRNRGNGEMSFEEGAIVGVGVWPASYSFAASVAGEVYDQVAPQNDNGPALAVVTLSKVVILRNRLISASHEVTIETDQTVSNMVIGLLPDDTTPPEVTLSVPDETFDSTPCVTVTGTDFNGLPDGTVVRLDVDLNNDGAFLDAGEADYTLSTLSDGSATFDVSPALAHGSYSIRARLVDQVGNEGTSAVKTVDLKARVVVGRYVFYNNSAFDGALGDDDDAIAPDKQALAAGQKATFANYTSYSRGINAVMIDIADLPDPSGLSAADFEFRVGNNNNPGSWPLLALDPSQISVSVREGEGVNGSDRVTVIFPDGAVKKTWLQVTVQATPAMGLAAPDVHYWGNAIGDCGNSPTDTAVNVADQLGARAHPHTLLTPAPIDDAYDYNRDKQVNVQDELIARSNPSTLLTDVNLIDLRGYGEEEGEGGGVAAMAWSGVSLSGTELPLPPAGLDVIVVAAPLSGPETWMPERSTVSNIFLSSDLFVPSLSAVELEYVAPLLVGAESRVRVPSGGMLPQSPLTARPDLGRVPLEGENIGENASLQRAALRAWRLNGNVHLPESVSSAAGSLAQSFPTQPKIPVVRSLQSVDRDWLLGLLEEGADRQLPCGFLEEVEPWDELARSIHSVRQRRLQQQEHTFDQALDELLDEAK